MNYRASPVSTPRSAFAVRFFSTVGSALAARAGPALTSLALGRALGPIGLGSYATVASVSAGIAVVLDCGAPQQLQESAGTGLGDPVKLAHGIENAYYARLMAVLVAVVMV